MCRTFYQGHTNNFGHPAVRDLLHVFLFGRDNRIGHLRPGEFGTRIPNTTLCLAVTAVSSQFILFVGLGTDDN
jgi:Domain of unknown function (DUF6532)